LLLIFEDKTIPNKIKVAKKALITSTSLLTIFQNPMIIILRFVLLYRNGVSEPRLSFSTISAVFEEFEN